MTTIKYENPKDNPAAKAAKLIEYLDLLASRDDFIADKSSYEAFFYIGIFCKYIDFSKEDFTAIFLKKNAAQIFTKALKSLYLERGELKFNSETNIETGSEPNASIDVKDIKESIFSYIIYSINILSRDMVRFEHENNWFLFKNKISLKFEKPKIHKKTVKSLKISFETKYNSLLNNAFI